MPSHNKRYTAAFKTEVAQKALDRDKENLDSLSKEYDVAVSVILVWATELENGGPEVFEVTADADSDENGFIEQPANIDLDVSDEEVAESLDYGVMFDKLNYKRLIFWGAFGVILLVIFVKALVEMNQYNIQTAEQQVGGEFYEVSQLKEEARERLNTFGVVNLEEGIYRIPVDSAISIIADGQE